VDVALHCPADVLDTLKLNEFGVNVNVLIVPFTIVNVVDAQVGDARKVAFNGVTKVLLLPATAFDPIKSISPDAQVWQYL
jgi:hypothetical protein